MNFDIYDKDSFVVIGKEGSTNDGSGFIKKLWDNANSSFNEISHLAKKDENGSLVGIWGAMSDFSHSFLPWEDNFSNGLYLAGVECNNDSNAPTGWTRWTIPSYKYICVENNSSDIFEQTLKYITDNNMNLVGAVHDFTCPTSGKNYMYFPIEIL